MSDCWLVVIRTGKCWRLYSAATDIEMTAFCIVPAWVTISTERVSFGNIFARSMLLWVDTLVHDPPVTTLLLNSPWLVVASHIGGDISDVPSVIHENWVCAV